MGELLMIGTVAVGIGCGLHCGATAIVGCVAVVVFGALQESE